MGRVLAVALAALLLAGCSKAYDETHRVVDRIFSFYRRKSPRQRPQAHPALSTITVTPEGRFIADGVQAATLTVRLRDAKGKPVPGQPVQLTVSGVGVVVSDPGVTDVQGVASATLAATRAGTKRVTVLADPGATNIRLHQEPVVEFDPAPPVQVAFAVQPAATVEGTTIPPVLRVEVRDVVGNVVTDATHAVSVSIGTNPGSGTVSGTITAAAVAGVATFGNLSIDRAGLGYRLAASASGLTGGASASFDVMPVAEVSFESAASDTPGETAGAHAVRVALSMPFGSLLSPVGVTVSDAGGGTATSGADYGVFAPATLSFPAGSTSGAMLSTPLSVLADTLVEGRETVRLAISGPTGPGRLGAGASHTATIVDDETATVAFASATSVSPGEAASALPVTVVLSTTGGATLASDLSVVATSTGGTATAGADYTAVTTTVNFAAGSGGGATRTVNIPVLADTLIEGSETVGLILSGISSNGALGAQTTHTATIGDDESASVAFTIAASATANETAGNHAVTATLSTTPGATLASALTVDASGVSGTATSGADYTAVATTLTFAAGSGNGATQTLNVPVLADTLIEGAETVGLALFNVSANGALGLQTTHAATITDDEALATVAFAAATSATAGEAAANHAVTVTLTTTGGATLGSAFTVSAASTGGTATAGTDYTAVATTVTFPAGSGNGATQAVNIPVLADLVFEGAETVVLTISSPSALGLLGATTTHTATITDDESATVAFTAAASATSGEAAANHGVTVTLSTSAGATLSSPLTVDAASTGGTAATGTDYTAVALTLTFPVGSGNGTTQTVNIPVLADNLVEGNETVILTLSNISGSGGLGAQTTHTATLTDDEGATVAFTAATSATANEAAANHAVTVTLTATNGATLASALTVNAASTGGTATAGADYTAVALTLNFPAASGNGAVQTVNLAVLADSLVEGNETVVLTLSSVSANGALGGTTTHTATLTDDETATVAFTAAASATAGEAAANHAVTVTLTATAGATLASALTVNAASAGGTATAGADYNAVAVTLTFPAASGNGAVQTVNVPVLADTLIEGNETVVLTLSSVSGSGGLGAQTTHTATLTDDETATVAFTAAASATADEAAANHAVTVTLTATVGATLASALTVNAASTGGTAAAGTDYNAVALTLTFPAASANGAIQTVNIPVLADALIEGNETVILTLSGVSANGALGATAAHTATITDDEIPTVAFTAAASATAGEAAANHAVTVTLTITGGATLASALTVDAASTGGSAAAGTDYNAVAVTLTFPAGSGNGAVQTVNVPVQADLLIEGNETVILTLSNVSGSGSLGSQTTHTATITDDETATVAFTAAASATASEAAANHAVTVTLTATVGATLASALTVNAANTGGTAAAGTDYTAVAVTLAFPAASANGATQTVNIPVLADTLAEGNETVILTLTGVSANGALGAQTTHTATITDDEATPTVAFTLAASASASEAAANHAVTVTLTTAGGATLAAALTVDAASTGGTATAGTDYTAVAVTLTFPAASANGATQTVNIPILADTLIEGNETVVLTLSNVSANGALGAQTTHTATITDDESATVAFTAATSATASEAAANHAVTVTLTTAGGATLASALTVNAANTGGTATAGTDYNAVAVTLTFPAASANGAIQTVNIPVLADTFIEGNETVVLTLSSVSANGALGAQTTHTATITDDEATPTVAFTAAASATVSETASNHAVTVTLTTAGGATLASALTVDAANTGGTATAGTDYTAVAVTVTFPATSGNGSTQTVNVAVLADTLIEGNETVILTLSSVSANGALGAQTTHTATITDDESATVAFTAAASATANESAVNHAVTATLTATVGATLAAALTVDAANTGGTATAGTDYTAVAVTLTFPAASANGATQTVNVPVLADLVIEGSETVVLTLSNVSANGALGAQTTHTATLTDDDGPATVAFNAASSATASEAAANHAVTLRLTTGGATLAGALTVDVASTNGTAIAGSDYTAVAATVTFAGGSGDGATQDANVPVLADVLVEGNETLTLTLSNVSSNGSLGAQTTHTVTITDDDATPPPKIETIAGDGTGAFLGDGGAATAARIQNERGVYPDASGNFWIGDTDNHRVRKVTAATGFISTVAGNGTAGANGDGAAATSAQLNTPFTVWVDPLGNLLLADRSNGKMRKVDAHTANISTVAGVGAAVPLGDGGPATDAHLNSPIGITVDASGHLLISDTSNHRIRKVDVHTGVITTVAGSGTGDFAGDGAAATAAQIKAPFHVALAANGDIYIADAQNNRVRKVTAATGFISTLAGDGTTGYTGDGAAATAAGLSNPVGVALDSAGDVYISDENHHVIRKVTVGTGVITTAVGDGTGGFLGDGGAATGARLNFPGQIAFDSAGRLYIADRNNQRVRRVYNLKSLSVSTAALARSPTNAAYRQAVRATGGSGSGYAWTVASGALPAGLSLTSGTPDAIISGTPTATGTSSFTLAVQDSESFAATRALSIVVGTPQLSTAAGDGLAGFAGDGGAATAARLNAPPGVAADSDGNVYIADATNHRVRKLTVATGVISTVAGDGTAGFLGDGGAATSARLDDPVAVAVDAAGNLYIADRDNHRIRRVLASAGTISTIVGDGTAGFAGDGADGTAARINTPTGVAVDLAGNVFIADQGNHRVRRLEAHIGHVTTYAGNGTQGFGGDGAAATAAQLDTPTGVAVDTAGNVYVADRGNHRVRKVTASTGNIATIAGDGTAGSTGDGGAATSARLSSPSALAVDGALNVYIADRDNHKIRRVDGTTASISTAVGDGTAGSLGDGGAATAGRLDTPQGVAVDASGNLHVADTNNHRARKATP